MAKAAVALSAQEGSEAAEERKRKVTEAEARLKTKAEGYANIKKAKTS